MSIDVQHSIIGIAALVSLLSIPITLTWSLLRIRGVYGYLPRHLILMESTASLVVGVGVFAGATLVGLFLLWAF